MAPRYENVCGGKVAATKYRFMLVVWDINWN